MAFSLIQIVWSFTLVQMTWGTASNSLSDCQQVANSFANTILNGPVANIVNTIGKNVTCPLITSSSCLSWYYDQ